MEIKLIDISGIEAVEVAASLPYNSKQSTKLVKNVIASNHLSILRHAQASFLLTNVSQSMLRQLSRHPHINLTVKSSRYCNMLNHQLYCPEGNLKPNSTSRDDDVVEYFKDLKTIMGIYTKWKEYEGETKEFDVAKLFLPLASTTDVVVSGNLQALLEFCWLRNCVRAEKEIKEVSNQISNILSEQVPFFGKIGCRFDWSGKCPEGKMACTKGRKNE